MANPRSDAPQTQGIAFPVNALRQMMVAAYRGGPVTRFGSQYALDAVVWVLAIVTAAGVCCTDR